MCSLVCTDCKESDTTWRLNNTLLDLGTCSWPIFQAVVLKTVLFYLWVIGDVFGYNQDKVLRIIYDFV